MDFCLSVTLKAQKRVFRICNKKTCPSAWFKKADFLWFAPDPCHTPFPPAHGRHPEAGFSLKMQGIKSSAPQGAPVQQLLANDLLRLISAWHWKCDCVRSFRWWNSCWAISSVVLSCTSSSNTSLSLGVNNGFPFW